MHVSCVLLLNSLGHCVVPVTCESSVLLETVVYFEFCTFVPVSVFKQLSLYSFWVHRFALSYHHSKSYSRNCLRYSATPLRRAAPSAVTLKYPHSLIPRRLLVLMHTLGTRLVSTYGINSCWLYVNSSAWFHLISVNTLSSACRILKSDRRCGTERVWLARLRGGGKECTC